MKAESVKRLEDGADAGARESLTLRQSQVLEFIKACIDERGYPPTLREIGGHLSIRSTNGVNDHLKALERKGYLKREDLKSRALRPVLSRVHGGPPRQGDDAMVVIPLVGEVAAGQPIFSAEGFESSFRVDRSLVGGGPAEDVFALRVKGDSMIDDGIYEGDYVFVRRQATARQGETVVALIDDETTVKRYYPEGSRIRLQPANDSMGPIYVDADDGRDVSILGVVVGLWRRLH